MELKINYLFVIPLPINAVQDVCVFFDRKNNMYIVEEDLPPFFEKKKKHNCGTRPQESLIR